VLTNEDRREMAKRWAEETQADMDKRIMAVLTCVQESHIRSMKVQGYLVVMDECEGGQT